MRFSTVGIREEKLIRGVKQGERGARAVGSHADDRIKCPLAATAIIHIRETLMKERRSLDW